MIVGTLYPLALEALTGERISVGAPFFNLTFVPLVVPLLAIVPFGPMLAWKRGDIRAASQRLMLAFGLNSWRNDHRGGLCRRRHDAAPLLGVWLGLWLIGGAISEIAYRVKLGTAPADESWRRARGLPRSAYGTALAHAGVGITVLGIVVASTWNTEVIRTMRPLDTVDLSGYSVTPQRIRQSEQP